MSSSVYFTDCLEFNNLNYVLSVQPNCIFCLDSITIRSWSFILDCINNIILNMSYFRLVSQNMSFSMIHFSADMSKMHVFIPNVLHSVEKNI